MTTPESPKCPKCGDTNWPRLCSCIIIAPQEGEQGPYYCDTFKGGVFGPNGLEVKTDDLLGNEVELLTRGHQQGALSERGKKEARIKELEGREKTLQGECDRWQKLHVEESEKVTKLLAEVERLRKALDR